MRQREPAICLGVHDYSETSQVVHFLTRGAGPVRLLAKGSKRAKSKSGGAIDFFSEGELVFITARGEGLGTLVEFAETVAHNALHKDSAALDAALFMIEAAGRLLGPGDPHPEVFDLLHNSLGRLGQADAPRPAVLAYFLWRLLRRAGLLGELRRCVSCGRELAVGVGRATGVAAPRACCTRDDHGPTSANPPSAAPIENPEFRVQQVARPTSGGEAPPTSFSSSLGGLLCRDCEGQAREKYHLGGLALAGVAALAAAEAAPRPGGKRAALPPEQAGAVIRLLAYHIGQQTGRALKMARHYKT